MKIEVPETLIDELNNVFINNQLVIKGQKISSIELLVVCLEHYTIQNVRKVFNCSASTLRNKLPEEIPSSTAPIARRILSLTKFRHCCSCNSYKVLTEFYRTEINDHCRFCYKRRREATTKKYQYPKDLKLHRFHEANRRAAKIQRTPKWADKEKIREIYYNCPKGYHVDHIIPLQGKNVSGLHVETNLQYLTEKENLSKSNSFDSIEVKNEK